jgi:hypothetical protein
MVAVVCLLLNQEYLSVASVVLAFLRLTQVAFQILAALFAVISHVVLVVSGDTVVWV